MGLSQHLKDNSDLLVRSFFAVSTLFVLLSGRSRTLYNYTLYGKRLRSSYRTLPSKYYVPRSCFSNFYLLGLVLNAYLFYNEHREFLNLFRVMFVVHLTRRLFEQILLFTKLPKPSVMHFASYLFGLSFYVVNAFALNKPRDFLPFKWALVLNSLAQVLQFYSHCKLWELRNYHSDDGKLYKVPKGGPFNFVLCPHYLAEILIYVSLSCNLNMVFCLVLVTTELVTLGLNNKKWYRATFSKSELLTDKALVPFLL